MKQYLELLEAIINNGNMRGDRTGTGTTSIFGYQFRCDLAEGFPLLTTKKLSFKNIAVELIWFLRGDTNIKYLLENDCHIWTPDAYRMFERKCSKDDRRWVPMDEFERKILSDEIFPAGDASDTWANLFGDLGPVYGKQWRKWESTEYTGADNSHAPFYIDQIKNVIESIKKNPEGRRHIVTAWNPAEVDAMALPPCHCLFQFYVDSGNLSCHLYQRSADVFLGVPYNIASYALLTHIIADQTGLRVGELIVSFGDVHIYNNHMPQVLTQLARDPLPLPNLSLSLGLEHRKLEDLDWHDFAIEDYEPYPAIKGELSVGT